MTRTESEPGKPRFPAELSIVMGSGCWLATIRCHAEGKVATIGVESLEGLAGALEKALINNRVPWRDFETWKGREQMSTKPKKK